MNALLTGKTALITGASSGIGLAAAARIAGMGAETVLVARDRQRGDRALADVRERAESSHVTLLMCDLGSMSSVRALAGEFRGRHRRLDLLVNNAGSVSPARRESADGVELTFAANYLGHFLLTHLLLDLLVRSAPARIVNVSSVAHRAATLDFDNLQFEHGGYSTMNAYGRSKLAQILFTRELAARVAGTGVTVNALHPGAVATNIWSHAPAITRPFLAVARLFMTSAARGGERIVYLATSPDVDGKTGGYYERDRLKEPALAARDAAAGRQLWERSLRLAGEA